jgi:hypothetical protein
MLHVRLHGAVTHEDLVSCCADAAADWVDEGVRYALLDFSDAGCCSFAEADLAMMTSACAALTGAFGASACVFVTSVSGGNRLKAMLDRCCALKAHSVEWVASATDAERRIFAAHATRSEAPRARRRCVQSAD